MTLQVQLPPRKKYIIVAFVKEGLSSRKIAARVDCNRSSLSQLLERKRKMGDVRRILGTGLKRVSTPGQDSFFYICVSPIVEKIQLT